MTIDDFQRRPLHLLMRYSDKLTSVENTIEAHEAVIKKKGAVWLGKMGKALAHSHVVTMNEQCERKIPTYVYLVQKFPRGYDVYRGTVLHITRTYPQDRQLIPPYYDKAKITGFVRLWQKLSELKHLDNNILKRLYIAKSGSSAYEALMHSMAAHFLIHDR